MEVERPPDLVELHEPWLCLHAHTLSTVAPYSSQKVCISQLLPLCQIQFAVPY